MLNRNWQIYGPSFSPRTETARDRPVTAEAERAEERNIPPFLTRALEKTADILNARFSGDTGIENEGFHLYTDWDEINNVVVVTNFGIHDPDERQTGKGSQILQIFLNKLSIAISRSVEVRLWSVDTAIGFYLKQGLMIDRADVIDVQNLYRQRKKAAFGDAEAKYKKEVEEKLPGDRPLTFDDLWPIYLESPIYEDSDDPIQLFSLWIEDILGEVANHLFIIVEPKTRLAAV